MGKNVGGVFSNWWGKVGNVVGRIRQGRTIMSIYQPQVHNPKTQAQLEQRLKFSVVTEFLSAVSGFIKSGFGKLDGYTYGTPYSAAVGYNLKKVDGGVVSGTYPNYEINLSKVVVAQGSVDLPYSPSATADGTTLSCTWADNSGMGNALGDDKVMLLAYNDAKKQSVYNIAAGERADRNASMTLPTAWTGDNVDIWMVMRRQSNGECSMSKHLASIPL